MKDEEIRKNAHQLYDEYKVLDQRYVDALKEAVSKFSDPFEDPETYDQLKELDNQALAAHQKWNEYRFKK